MRKERCGENVDWSNDGGLTWHRAEDETPNPITDATLYRRRAIYVRDTYIDGGMIPAGGDVNSKPQPVTSYGNNTGGHGSGER